MYSHECEAGGQTTKGLLFAQTFWSSLSYNSLGEIFFPVRWASSLLGALLYQLYDSRDCAHRVSPLRATSAVVTPMPRLWQGLNRNRLMRRTKPSCGRFVAVSRTPCQRPSVRGRHRGRHPPCATRFDPLSSAGCNPHSPKGRVTQAGHVRKVVRHDGILTSEAMCESDAAG